MKAAWLTDLHLDSQNFLRCVLQRLLRRRSAAIDGSTPVGQCHYFNGSSKPYVRWWWLKGPFLEADIAEQLDWLRDNGFGGVEIAWLAPSWLGPHQPPPAWLSPEWARLTSLASRLAEERGLGCDFTFGSCWPFGGSRVAPADASQTFSGASWERLEGSWEVYQRCECRVVNHLSKDALARYAKPLCEALAPAVRRNRTAFFCDSLELQTEGLWDARLWPVFKRRFGYRLEPFVQALDSNLDVRYDYRKLIAETLTREFYQAFSEICQDAGALSRVQCHGSPTDLLAAYGAVDIPESEALLFNPQFSRIPASAAALTGKPVVSAETFTCTYGFSHVVDSELRRLWKNEDIGDLRLLADAIVANGVNQIVWHGMPFNPTGGDCEFYAAVHVGPDSGFADMLPEFNRYLARLCGVMQGGKTLSQMAVCLPNEDNWMAGRIPDEERTPGATHRWQMRHVAVPREVEGYHPLWVSASYLAQGVVVDRKLRVNETTFDALYVDCAWLDIEGLIQICRHAKAGLPVVMKRRPVQPGHRPNAKYDKTLAKLMRRPNVVPSIEACGLAPFASASQLPFYWAREAEDAIFVFLAHPAARDIAFPMRHGQSRSAEAQTVPVLFQWKGRVWDVDVGFGAGRSTLLRLGLDGRHAQSDLEFEHSHR